MLQPENARLADLKLENKSRHEVLRLFFQNVLDQNHSDQYLLVQLIREFLLVNLVTD